MIFGECDLSGDDWVGGMCEVIEGVCGVYERDLGFARRRRVFGTGRRRGRATARRVMMKEVFFEG